MQPLRSQRRLIEQRAKISTPKIRNIWNWQSILQSKIVDYDEKELSNLLEDRKSITRFLVSIFPDIDPSFDFEAFQLQFPNLQNRNPELSQDVERAARSYEKWKQIPSPKLLSALFFEYKDDRSQQLKIAEYFWVTLSLKDLVDYGIYDIWDVEKVAQKYYKTLWNSVDNECKRELVKILVNDDAFNLSIAEIDTTKIDDINWKRIESRFQKSYNNQAEYLLWKWKDIGDSPIFGDLYPVTHEGVMKKIPEIRNHRKKPILENIEKIQKNAVITWKDQQDQKTVHAIRINDINVPDKDNILSWVTMSILTGKDGAIGAPSPSEFLDYEQFSDFLADIGNARVISEHEFDAIKTTNKDEATDGSNIFDATIGQKIYSNELIETKNTKDWFLEQIKEIDPDWEKYGMQVGTTFISRSSEPDKKWVKHEWAYTIVAIDNHQITISNGKDREVADFATFVEVARNNEQGFHRVACINTDTDYLKALAEFGVDVAHTELKDGQLITEVHGAPSDDHHGDGGHTHDDHGHTEYKAKKIPIEFFQSKDDGSHIRIGSIVGGKVFFWEYSADKTVAEIQKLNKGDKLKKKQKDGLYDWQYMSYGMFLNYLKKNNMKATTENLLIDADHEYKWQDPHLETNWLKSYMKKPSIGDIFNGIKWVIHGVEHFLEKWSKLNASRSALWMARKFWLPADITAQLTADEVGNMKEIIQKMVDKLKSLNGPHARDKALHIVHDKWSRPEEVAAAALFMVQSYGHLYAEDIRHAQWSESFINALIYACGYTTTAEIREQKQKARLKFKWDTGKEPGAQITEEEMIWGFLKWIDGNYDSNPLAGALVKAMWGPSGWEKSWRDEGYKWAREKWVRQTSDLPNGQGRLNKFMSALSTHEFNTALGMMETIPGKNPWPELQWAPVIWALTGMSQYIGTKTAQDIWQFCASKWHSFHAYAFLRNKQANDQYKAVFLSALDGIASSSEIDQLKNDIATVQHTWHEHEKYGDKKTKAQLAAFQNINNLWVRYQWRGLHDRLQWKNDWLIKQTNEHHDPAVGAYLTQMAQVHEQNSGTKAHSDDNGWYIQKGTVGSPIMSPKKIKATIDGEEKEYQVNSLDFMLHKLGFASGAGISFRDNNDIERIWNPCVALVNNLTKNTSRTTKAQYKQYRYDILRHFNDTAAGIKDGLSLMKQRTYYKDFLSMGIDPSVLFSGGDDLDKRLNGGWEADFEKWRMGWRHADGNNSTDIARKRTHDSVFNRISSRNAANDDQMNMAA
jgi:hypothetical protein